MSLEHIITGIGAFVSLLSNAPNIPNKDLNRALNSVQVQEQHVEKEYSPRRIPYDSWQEAVADISTPEEVSKFQKTYMRYRSDAQSYGYSDFIASFELMFKKREIGEDGNEYIFDDCDGYAVMAASLLNDDGYPPLFLSIYRRQSEFNIPLNLNNTFLNIPIPVEYKGGHGIFIYQEEDERWRTINNGHISRYSYNTPERLVRSYNHRYFKIYNFDDIDFSENGENDNFTWPNYHGNMILPNPFLSTYTSVNGLPELEIQISSQRSQEDLLALAEKKELDYIKDLLRKLLNEEPVFLPFYYIPN